MASRQEERKRADFFEGLYLKQYEERARFNAEAKRCVNEARRINEMACEIAGLLGITIKQRPALRLVPGEAATREEEATR